MAYIDLRETFDSLARAIGSSDANPEFVADFLLAVKDALSQINYRANFATAVAPVGSIDQTVLMSDRFRSQFQIVITYYLSLQGRRLPASDTKRDPTTADLKEMAKVACDEIYEMGLQDAQVDSTQDVAGLGAPRY